MHMTKVLRQEMDRTENKNAAVAKGINANMRCFCRLAWLTREVNSENMWWRLVSPFSQIKRLMFNVTTVPCNSHVSFIVLRVLGCMWVWFFFIKSDKHLISRSNEVALMKTEMLGWLHFFLCGGKIAKSFQNMRQFFCEKQKDVK